MMPGMSVEEALETVRIWHECDLQDCCKDSPACALSKEIDRMREVIADYVHNVDSGENYQALVELVPGLVDDTGTYGAVDQSCTSHAVPVVGHSMWHLGGEA